MIAKPEKIHVEPLEVLLQAPTLVDEPSILVERDQDREAEPTLPLTRLQHLAVGGRHHLHKLGKHYLPVVQHFARPGTVRVLQVPFQHLLQRQLVGGVFHRLQFHHPRVAPVRKVSAFVQHVGHATAHSRGKVAPRAPQDHNHPSGHLLAPVVSNAFHHRISTAVAHGEPLSGHASQEHTASRSAVQGHVAHNHIVLGDKG